MTAAQLGPALLLAAMAASAVAACGFRRNAVAAIAIVAGLLALMPLGGISTAGYLLALPGPLSAATLILSSQLLLRAVGLQALARPSTAFLVCLVVSAVPLYAAAAGFFVFDVYDLGFRGLAVPLAMAVFVIAGWLARTCDVAVWAGIGALLYVIGAYPSDNLWNYLMDPVAFIAAAVMLVARLWRWHD